MKNFVYIFLTLILTNISFAADIGVDEENDIYIHGEIAAGDARKLNNVMFDGATIFVHSIGGDAYESINMFSIINNYENITISTYDSPVCESACANLAMAADQLIGVFGFHLAFLDYDSVKAEDMTYEAIMQIDALNSYIMYIMWYRWLTPRGLAYIQSHAHKDKTIHIKFPVEE